MPPEVIISLGINGIGVIFIAGMTYQQLKSVRSTIEKLEAKVEKLDDEKVDLRTFEGAQMRTDREFQGHNRRIRGLEERELHHRGARPPSSTSS